LKVELYFHPHHGNGISESYLNIDGFLQAVFQCSAEINIKILVIEDLVFNILIDA
jgi:hypothetical protein